MTTTSVFGTSNQTMKQSATFEDRVAALMADGWDQDQALERAYDEFPDEA